MKFDIVTLVYLHGITVVIQFIAIFVQYRINKSYRGLRWWLLGAAFMVAGDIFVMMVNLPSLVILARFSNLLVVIGQISIYIGTMRFLGKKEHRWIFITILAAFTVSYYFYMVIVNDISSRTVALCTTLAAISIITASRLLFRKDRFISDSATFTGIVFLFNGCFLIVRVFFALLLPPIQVYSDQATIFALSFIVPIITGTLATFGFIIMVNQRLNTENRLEKEKLQQIFNTGPDAALITRMHDGLVVDVNAGFLTLTGYSRQEVIGYSLLNISFWKNISDRSTFISELKDKENCENQEFVFVRKNGCYFDGTISARLTTIHAEPHIISVVHDITERKLARKALLESEEKYRSILNASPDDITITDLEGRIIMVSPASKKMFGYKQDYDGFVGRRLLEFIVPDDVARAQHNMSLMYQGASPKPNEYRGVRQDGSVFDIEVNSGFILNASGQPTSMVFIVRDITERKMAEKHINELIQQLEIEKNIAEINSITDSLTGLANRRYFDEAMNTEFFRLKRSGAFLSLMMLDIDYFKKFNDSYGHLAGDECLRQIGNILKTIAGRAPDIVVRYGGEEFVIILPETDDNGTEALAKRIQKAIEALSIPHEMSDISSYITVSIGVVTVRPAQLESPKELVALVDKALYRAKNAGRNRIEVLTV